MSKEGTEERRKRATLEPQDKEEDKALFLNQISKSRTRDIKVTLCKLSIIGNRETGL